MPRKFQDPKLEIRNDVKRPFYFIRVSVPIITAEGRSTKRTPQILGFLDEMSKKQAMLQRAAVLSTVNQHRMVAQAQLTFSVLAERFISAEVPNLGPAAAKRYEGQLRLHLIPAFGAIKLCEFDGSMLQEFLIAKQAEGLGDWSLHGLKGIVSAMFAAAKRWKLWEGDNPAEGVRFKRKGAVYEKKLLTGEQLRTILAAVAERERFLILILFGLGLRISEALGLKWCDINRDTNEVKIERGWTRGSVSDGKTENSGRVLQLGPLAQEFVKRYPGPQALDKWVFEDWSGNPPDDRDLLRECFRPVIKRLGLYYPGFGWHAFRRCNVTLRQTVGGATAIEAMKAAGHGSVDMTLLYTLSDRQREAEQVNRMFNHLYELPDGGTKQ
jgi:integrase